MQKDKDCYQQIIKDKNDEINKLNKELNKLIDLNDYNAKLTIDCITRCEDNFVNATKISYLTGKNVDEWLCLAITKNIINNFINKKNVNY